MLKDLSHLFTKPYHLHKVGETMKACKISLHSTFCFV